MTKIHKLPRRFFFLLLSSCWLLASCHIHLFGPKRTEEDLIKIVGVAKVEGQRTEAGIKPHVSKIPSIKFDNWKKEIFKGEGQAEPPANASGDVQRLAVARAEARRNAIRGLTTEVLASRPSDKEPALSELMKRHADWPDLLIRCIEEQSEIEYGQQVTKIMARAKLAGTALIRAVQAGSGNVAEETEISAGSAPQTSLAQRREEAQKRALEDARRLLREELLKTPTRDGSLGSMIGQSPEVSGQLDRLLGLTDAHDIQFKSDGTCEVTILFDRNRALHLIPQR